jgi:hypothetical protein
MGRPYARVLLAAGAALLLAGCQPSGPGSGVTSVTIDGGDVELVVGEQVELTATVVATGGAGTAVSWASGDPSVAAVVPLGSGGALVTAVSPGVTTVTATSEVDDTRSDDVAVTVREEGEHLLTVQFGTPGGDYGEAVAMDAVGNVYVTGYTYGSFEGANQGGRDVFVSKYAPDGTHVWTRQFGSLGDDAPFAIAVGPDGGVVVAGQTTGSLTAEPNAGLTDGFLRKYSSLGDHLWTRRVASIGSDTVTGLTVDPAGNVAYLGTTSGVLGTESFGGYDLFLGLSDADGEPLWFWQFGSEQNDLAYDVAADPEGNLYVFGLSVGVLPDVEGFEPGDTFVAKYDGQGEVVWVRSFRASTYLVPRAVAVRGSDGVVVAGAVAGTLPGTVSGGLEDGFVRVYDGAGNHGWTRQFGTGAGDRAEGVAVDPYGNVVVAGPTEGQFPGHELQGLVAAVARKYSANGDHLWTRQFGTTQVTYAKDVAVGPSGVIVVLGDGVGALGDESFGDFDGWLRFYGR